MEIRFISSLTEEDENMFAPALLKAVGVLLDQLPIAYTLRIETTGSQVFQHSHALTELPRPDATSNSAATLREDKCISILVTTRPRGARCAAAKRAHARNTSRLKANPVPSFGAPLDCES